MEFPVDAIKKIEIIQNEDDSSSAKVYKNGNPEFPVLVMDWTKKIQAKQLS